MVSRRLAKTGKIEQRPQVRVPCRVKYHSIDAISELGFANGFQTLGVSVVRDCVC